MATTKSYDERIADIQKRQEQLKAQEKASKFVNLVVSKT